MPDYRIGLLAELELRYAVRMNAMPSVAARVVVQIAHRAFGPLRAKHSAPRIVILLAALGVGTLKATGTHAADLTR